MLRTKHCTELKPNDNVLFCVDVFQDGSKTILDGSVSKVSQNHVEVDYLVGYKYYANSIPFEDMVAVFDKSGDPHVFPGYHGTGFKLIP